MSEKEKKISHKWLTSVLSYNHETGLFTWSAKAQKNTVIGTVAGCKNARGYLQIGLRNSLFQQHRLAWFYVYGFWPDGEIDHINRKRDDNRIANLRIVDRSKNSRNRDVTSRSTSGIKWVCFDNTKKKWRVDVGYGEERKFFGNYVNLSDAERVADEQYKIHAR